jgi:hypothetical protein
MNFEYWSKNNKIVYEFDYWYFIRRFVGLGILFIWIGGFFGLIGRAIYENNQPIEYNYITVLDKKEDLNGRVWIKTRNSDGRISKYPQAPRQGADPFVSNVNFEVGKTYRVSDPINRYDCSVFIVFTFLFALLSCAVVPVSLAIADLLD